MSCCKCLLYDFDCLRNYGGFQASVSEEQLKHYITTALEVEIIPLIGEECYDWLCAARDSVEGFNAVQEQFFNKLQPYIAWAVRWQFVSDPGEVYPVGYIVELGGGYERADGKTLQAAIGRADRNKDFYKNELLKWLNAQSVEDIPCWPECQDCCKPKHRPGGSNSITITSWR